MTTTEEKLEEAGEGLAVVVRTVISQASYHGVFMANAQGALNAWNDVRNSLYPSDPDSYGGSNGDD